MPKNRMASTPRRSNLFDEGIHSGWRKRWDSNPRNGCPLAGFQDQCLKPLGHLSSDTCCHGRCYCLRPGCSLPGAECFLAPAFVSVQRVLMEAGSEGGRPVSDRRVPAIADSPPFGEHCRASAQPQQRGDFAADALPSEVKADVMPPEAGSVLPVVADHHLATQAIVAR